MHIAIHSASAAVARTLESLIEQSGHRLAKAGQAADLVLVDSLHPATGELPAAPALYLGNANAGENALACPLRPEKLLQRLVSHRSTQAIALGNGWSLDLLARSLQHAEGAASLTEKEAGLLHQLLEARPHPIARDDLLEQVWGMSAAVDTHTLETHIYRLRAKLGALSPIPCDILTENGAYGLVLPANNG